LPGYSRRGGDGVAGCLGRLGRYIGGNDAGHLLAVDGGADTAEDG
jgi:hypothetical protein